MAWPKSDFGLGHANAITQLVLHSEEPKVSADERVEKHFSGAKAVWHPVFDDLLKKVNAFGSDVHLAPTNSYISILRKNRKFAIVQVTANRFDIGIKCKGVPAEGRFEEAGDWNTMVTHRVQIDAEIISRLHQAYDNA